MFWLSCLLVWTTKYVASQYPTLSPEFSDVLENSSLEFTCHTHINTSETHWGNSNSTGSFKFSNLTVLEGGGCKATNFLGDYRYFETHCDGNGSFIVKIKSVNMSYHGQKWYCKEGFNTSDNVSISVQVPIKFVRIHDIPKKGKNVITAIENVTTTLSCEASEGRPPANISWTKLSKDGTSTSLTQSASSESFQLANGMKKVQSNLTLTPLREDNDSHIICEATNKISNITQKKVKFYVKFQCICNGAPVPACMWSITNDLKSPNLKFSNIIKSGKGNYECLAENNITRFPKYETKRAASKANLEIDVLCTPLLSPGFTLKTNFSCAQNKTASFAFKANAYPEPEFQWFKLSGTSWKQLESCNKTEIETVEQFSILNISDIVEEDFGQYKLRIVNEIGSLEQLYFLKANRKPDPPTMFRCLHEFATETSTILQWKPGFNGGPEQKFILRYKLVLGTKWTKISLPNIGDKTMNYTVTSLESNSNYWTELFAMNSEGQSMTLNLTFKTRDNPKLIETWILDWKFMLYGSGGIMFISTLLVVTCLILKRTKRQSTASVIYQNVPSCEPNAEDIYQNVPSACEYKTETNKSQSALHSMTAVEYELEDVTIEQDEDCSGDCIELNEFDEEPVEYCNKLEQLEELETIKVSELFHYYKDRRNESFSDDFKNIPTAFQMPCLFARRPGNISCNRYKGIIPYDHSRVQIENQPEFYINASYIDGYKRPKAYIACLGPTSRTHDDFKSFWNMVWDKKVEIIVMVTKLNELSGMKCEQYWPDIGLAEDYGDILVSCEKVQIFADYTLRTFEVGNNAETGEVCRRLVHLNYTAWPDKTVPEDVTSLLEFRHRCRDIKTIWDGPVIVHCSAGIGRTGVFIAIDILIMEGKEVGAVNVHACVKKMREQRVKMVQTSEQYKFIFKALVYAFQFDCEPVPVENLIEYIDDVDESLYNRLYKELESSLERIEREGMSSQANYENVWDNGNHGADIAESPHRVRLCLNKSLEDSDFINAVYVNSYKKKDNFIMAQSPLPGTESDFLTMIYQEYCHCIVSLDDIEQNTMINNYLPAERDTLEMGSFTVSCSVYDPKPQYLVRKVTIKNKEESSNGEREFYHFQYKKWADTLDVPESTKDFVEFVNDVKKYATLNETSTSHVLVHCLNASERSGLFCSVAVMMEKLLFDQKVSVLNTLRQIGIRRPHAITSVGQMIFCYQAVQAIVQMHKKLCIRYDRLL